MLVWVEISLFSKRGYVNLAIGLTAFCILLRNTKSSRFICCFTFIGSIWFLCLVIWVLLGWGSRLHLFLIAGNVFLRARWRFSLFLGRGDVSIDGRSRRFEIVFVSFWFLWSLTLASLSFFLPGWQALLCRTARSWFIDCCRGRALLVALFLHRLIALFYLL